MSDRRYRHRLTCGCEVVSDASLLAPDARCPHHDAPALVVETRAHVWRGMRRVDVDPAEEAP